MIRSTTIAFILCVMPVSVYSQGISAFLIQQDIASFKRVTRGGPSGSVLAGAGHFGLDHQDKAYGIAYVNDQTEIWVDVQVTRHAGGESDKWLLHEVEDGFRRNPEQDYFKGKIREVNNNRIITYIRGTHYSWISNNVVVDIKYTDLQKTKPEPLVVVRSYLALHPSTITLTDAEIKSRAHNELWIKDEMDRRLWLGGKWMGKITNVGEDRKKILIRVVDHLNVFLDYREKYFGVAARNEKGVIDRLLQVVNKDAIEAKLNEYYQWWNQNKDGPINLQ